MPNIIVRSDNAIIAKDNDHKRDFGRARQARVPFLFSVYLFSVYDLRKIDKALSLWYN
jgi:hypothetical protein